LQLRDALELHVLIVNDAIQLLFHGKDQVFEAAEVVAYGKREVGRRNRRHVEACGEAAILPRPCYRLILWRFFAVTALRAG